MRVAIAGCHRMLGRQPGSHNWAAAFDAVPDTRIVAVFDKGADTRTQFVECWSSPDRPIAAYDAFDAMLRDVHPDLLCIATRQTMHADQIARAADAGVRGILCDKPLATSLAEVDQIVSTCRDSHIPLAFGLDRRWTTRYRWARQLIVDGALGRVQTIIAYGLANVINHGCHWYDAALMLAGDPDVAWVSGFVDDVSADPPTSARRLDPSGRAQIALANGVTVYVTPDGRPGPAFEILGDRGRLLLLQDARAPYLWQHDTSAGSVPTPVPVEAPAVTEPWEAGPAAVADLVDAVRSGATTACDLSEAYCASAIGFAIHASSAAGGRRLTLSEVDPKLRIPSLPWGNE
ncbi:MAG TPA: Gfo/Idh/MocA family oxidoreductase [Chloroflexota bacterium]|nr:Gfo/Idh/MocA family oxidoreductase [Chloroflexota bacterium]